MLRIDSAIRNAHNCAGKIMARYSRIGIHLLATLLTFVATVAQAQSPSRLEKMMGSERFKQAGLDQQSAAQLQVLQDWIVAHGEELAEVQPASEAASASSAANKSNRGWFGGGTTTRKADAPSSTVISKIDGEFTGWRGSTTLQLENGQQWRIKDGSSLSVRSPLDRPQVTVTPGMIGGWYLKVKGYNTSALVEPAN